MSCALVTNQEGVETLFKTEKEKHQPSFIHHTSQIYIYMYIYAPYIYIYIYIYIYVCFFFDGSTGSLLGSAQNTDPFNGFHFL
jgi:hypothetical protein